MDCVGGLFCFVVDVSDDDGESVCFSGGDDVGELVGGVSCDGCVNSVLCEFFLRVGSAYSMKFALFYEGGFEWFASPATPVEDGFVSFVNGL